MSTCTVRVNTIIIGGGHAGINLACMLELEKPDENYLILERDGSLLVKWRKFRWEHFNLNTPVKFGMLYGQVDHERDPWLLERSIEGELERWDAHISKIGIRYRLNSNVVKVTKDEENSFFITTVEEGSPLSESNHHTVTYLSNNVAVCNGYYDAPVYPKNLATKLPSTIKQHVPTGFKFNSLKEGNVLIVGCGQTGAQISDLLLRYEPNRKLFLCTSAVPGTPRSFQGRDLFDWLKEMKLLDIPREALENLPSDEAEALRYRKVPVTGPTKDISPFSLHRQGVELLGHLDNIEPKPDGGDGSSQGVIFCFKADRGSNLKISYQGFCRYANAIKEFAKQPDAPDPPEWSSIEPELLNEPGRLKIDSDSKDNISNIVWCTGWSRDFSFLQIQGIEKDMDRKTKAPDLVASKAHPGLFYCGFPWIGTSQSLNLINFNHDAKIIMEGLRSLNSHSLGGHSPQ